MNESLLIGCYIKEWLVPFGVNHSAHLPLCILPSWGGCRQIQSWFFLNMTCDLQILVGFKLLMSLNPDGWWSVQYKVLFLFILPSDDLFKWGMNRAEADDGDVLQAKSFQKSMKWSDCSLSEHKIVLGFDYC